MLGKLVLQPEVPLWRVLPDPHQIIHPACHEDVCLNCRDVAFLLILLIFAAITLVGVILGGSFDAKPTPAAAPDALIVSVLALGVDCVLKNRSSTSNNLHEVARQIY